MKRKINRISMMAVAAVVFLGALLFSLERDENGSWKFAVLKIAAQSETGSGFGWDDRDIQCPRDQWAWVTTSTVSSGSDSYYVKAGNYVPGTSVIAGVNGYYNSQTANSSKNLRETYKQTCVEAEWHYYCSGPISCRVLF